MKGYRGYDISTRWVEDHWVHDVFFQGDWVDSFLDLEDLRTTIDSWHNAR